MNFDLTFEEARVIGSLIEKELTTPEYYPLTINSLMNACNQKSNREPVVSFDEKIIEETLEKLRGKGLARRVTGNDIRVAKYRQTFTESLNLSPDETAVICTLLLRGAQTPGEIKGRSGRMFDFESLTQIDEVLQKLIQKENPMVIKLPRQSGMKESRFTHLFSGVPIISETDEIEVLDHSGVDNRIEKLEKEVDYLHSELNNLKLDFEKFKNQF